MAEAADDAVLMILLLSHHRDSHAVSCLPKRPPYFPFRLPYFLCRIAAPPSLSLLLQLYSPAPTPTRASDAMLRCIAAATGQQQQPLARSSLLSKFPLLPCAAENNATRESETILVKGESEEKV